MTQFVLLGWFFSKYFVKSIFDKLNTRKAVSVHREYLSLFLSRVTLQHLGQSRHSSCLFKVSELGSKTLHMIAHNAQTHKVCDWSIRVQYILSWILTANSSRCNFPETRCVLHKLWMQPIRYLAGCLLKWFEIYF